MKSTIQRAWGYPHDCGNPHIIRGGKTKKTIIGCNWVAMRYENSSDSTHETCSNVLSDLGVRQPFKNNLKNDDLSQHHPVFLCFSKWWSKSTPAFHITAGWKLEWMYSSTQPEESKVAWLAPQTVWLLVLPRTAPQGDGIIQAALLQHQFHLPQSQDDMIDLARDQFFEFEDTCFFVYVVYSI